MGALFMPFLAFALLILNNKFINEKKQKNNLFTNSILVLVLILFVVLFGFELASIL